MTKSGGDCLSMVRELRKVLESLANSVDPKQKRIDKVIYCSVNFCVCTSQKKTDTPFFPILSHKLPLVILYFLSHPPIGRLFAYRYFCDSFTKKLVA